LLVDRHLHLREISYLKQWLFENKQQNSRQCCKTSSSSKLHAMHHLLANASLIKTGCPSEVYGYGRVAAAEAWGSDTGKNRCGKALRRFRGAND